MPFEGLGDKLQSAFKDLRGKGKLSESDIDAALREVRRALLEADVNFKVARISLLMCVKSDRAEEGLRQPEARPDGYQNRQG